LLSTSAGRCPRSRSGPLPEQSGRAAKEQKPAKDQEQPANEAAKGQLAGAIIELDERFTLCEHVM